MSTGNADAAARSLPRDLTRQRSTTGARRGSGGSISHLRLDDEKKHARTASSTSQSDAAVSKGNALLVAATDGELTRVQELVRSGASVNFRNAYKYTPLIKACRMKRVEVAAFLIDKGALVDARSENGWTPLIEAARVGSVELVRMLLKHGASPEDDNKMGWTPLIEACRNAHFDTIQCLVEEGGARIDHQDKDNFTAKDHTTRALGHIREYLKRMYRKQEMDVRKSGFSYGVPQTPSSAENEAAVNKSDAERMVDAAAHGELDTIQALDKQRVPLNSVNKNGAYSALTLACRNEQLEVAKYIIQNFKGDTTQLINYRSTTGWTALIEAARVGNEALVQLLVDKGALIDLPNDFGWPPLIEACRNAHYNVVEILLTLGANVQATDCDGETPLDHTNHPWIRSLLEDARLGGARSQLAKVVRTTRVEVDGKRMSQEARDIKIANLIVDLEKFRDPYIQRKLSLEFALFEVFVQQQEPHLIDLVLRKPEFKSAVLNNPVNIFHSIVQLAGPDDDDRAQRDAVTPTRLASRLIQCMEQINKSLFDDSEEKVKQFANVVNPATRGSAMLACASRYCASLEKAAELEGVSLTLPNNAAHFFLMLQFFLRIGSATNAKDGTNSTLLHYLLRPVAAIKMSDSPILKPAVENFQLIWQEFFLNVASSQRILPAALNVSDDKELTPLCYALVMTEVAYRKDIIVSLLNKGGLFPVGKRVDLQFEQNLLMTFLEDYMRNPTFAWRIMYKAVLHKDVSLVREVLARGLPIPLERPKATELGPSEHRPSSIAPMLGQQQLIMPKKVSIGAVQDATGARSANSTGDHDADGNFSPRSALKSRKRSTSGDSPRDHHPAGSAIPSPAAQPLIMRAPTLLDLQTKGNHNVSIQPGIVNPPSGEFEKSLAPGLDECLLHVAVESESEPIFEMLLEYSEQTSRPWPGYPHVTYPWSNDEPLNATTWTNTLGQTTFHVIANKKSLTRSNVNSEMFARLLQKDETAMVTVADHQGCTALHYAARHNKIQIVSTLAHAHIALDKPTTSDDMDVTHSNQQETALHIAAGNGHWGVVLVLLKHRVPIDVIDAKGYTPLARAMMARQLFAKKLDAKTKPAEDKAAKRKSDNMPSFWKRISKESATKPAADVAHHGDAHHPSASSSRGASPVGVESIALTALPSSTSALSRQGLLAESPSADLANDHKHTPSTDAHLVQVHEVNAATPGPLSPDSQTLFSPPTSPRPAFLLKSPTFVSPTTQRFIEERLAQQEAQAQSNQSAEQTLDVKLEKFAANSKAELATKKKMYDLTVAALLDNNSSIASAVANSGRSLYRLMDVDEKWNTLSGDLESITANEKQLWDEYYKFAASPSATAKERRDKRRECKLQCVVLNNRRNKLFLDKEAQMVINEHFEKEIGRNQRVRLCSYILFVVLLTGLGVFMTTRDTTSSFLVNQGIVSKLSTNNFFDDSGLPADRYPIDIKTWETIDADHEDFYQWCHNLLPDVLTDSSPNWVTQVGNQTARNSRQTPVNALNWNTAILGRARVRQIRSAPSECANVMYQRVMDNRTALCYSNNEDDAPFGPDGRYTHSSQFDLGGVTIWGQVFSLSGGGYVVQLPDLRTAHAQDIQAFCKGLENDDFIDGATRAVFFEMVVLSPSEHHFAIVTLLLEFSLSGAITSTTDVNVSRLYRYPDDRYLKFYLALQILAAVVWLYHIWLEVKQMKRSRDFGYLKSVYGWIDIFIMLGVPVIFILEGYGYGESENVTWDDFDSFPKVHELGRIYYAQRYILSIMILISWLKLFEYLSVFKEFYRLVIIIETSAASLKYIFGVFLIVLMGFTSAEYVAYGFKSHASKTWTWGFLNRLLAIFSGNPLLIDHTRTDRVLGMSFNILFVIIFSMLLLNLIVAMLTSGFEKALRETGDVMARRQYDKLYAQNLVVKRVVHLGTDQSQSYLQPSRTLSGRPQSDIVICGCKPGKVWDHIFNGIQIGIATVRYPAIRCPCVSAWCYSQGKRWCHCSCWHGCRRCCRSDDEDDKEER